MPPGLREWFLQEWTWNQWTGVTSATSSLAALVYPLSCSFLNSATVSVTTGCPGRTADVRDRQSATSGLAARQGVIAIAPQSNLLDSTVWCSSPSLPTVCLCV